MMAAACTAGVHSPGTVDTDRVASLVERGELDRAARLVRNAGADELTDPASRDRMIGWLGETRRLMETTEDAETRDSGRVLLCTLRYRVGLPETDPDRGARRENGPDAPAHDATDPEVDPPKPIFAPPPRFTESARRNRYQAEVRVRLIIDTEGCVRTVEPLSREKLGLVDRTVQTMSTWVFRPAVVGEEPVAVSYELSTTFRTS